MATLGFGIRITVSGNFQKGLQQAKRGTDSVTNAQKRLIVQSNRSRSIALKQAAAFGLLGGAALRLGQSFNSLAKKMVGLFGGIVKEAVSFQTEMLKLKVFFGDDSASITGAILQIAKTSNLATKDVVFIGSKLGQLGVRGKQAEKSIRLVAQALGAQSSVQRTKALGTIANIFQNTQSLARLLNISLSEQEKKAFSASNGLQRVAVVNDILAKRFGKVFDIMGLSIDFLWPQFIQLLQTIAGIIGQGFLEDLRVGLATIVKQMNKFIGLGKQANRVMRPLSKIIKDMLSPISGFVKLVADLELVPKFFKFLADNPGITKGLAIFGTLGAAGVGGFLSLAGSLFLVAASISLFKSAGLAKIFVPLGKGIAKFATGGLGGFFKTLLSPLKLLTKIPALFSFKGIAAAAGAFKGIAIVLGTLLIKIAAIIVVAVILITIFKALAKPLGGFFEGFFQGAKSIISGLVQIFRTGQITKRTFNALANSGLLPFFRILSTMLDRVRRFFVGLIGGIQAGMKPLANGIGTFQDLFDTLSFAFRELSAAIVGLLIDFGLMDDAGSDLAGGLGASLGATIGAIVQALIIMVQALVLAIVFTKTLFAAFGDIFSSNIISKLLLIAGLIAITFGALPLGIGLIAAAGIVALAAGGVKGTSFADTRTGRSFGSIGGPTLNPSQQGTAAEKDSAGTTDITLSSNLFLDGEKVAESVDRVNDSKNNQENANG